MSFHFLLISEPQKLKRKVLNTEIMDEFGAKYTADGLKLIKGPNDIKSYTIRKGTKVIENHAFVWCQSIQTINIPDSVTYIGNSAFSGCESLKSVNISNSITEIGDYVFADCKSLKSVSIPNSVTCIGNSAFSGCESLKNVGDGVFSYCI